MNKQNLTSHLVGFLSSAPQDSSVILSSRSQRAFGSTGDPLGLPWLQGAVRSSQLGHQSAPTGSVSVYVLVLAHPEPRPHPRSAPVQPQLSPQYEALMFWKIKQHHTRLKISQNIACDFLPLPESPTPPHAWAGSNQPFSCC